MRKIKISLVVSLVLIFLLAVVSFASHQESKMYQAGQLLMQYLNSSVSIDSSQDSSDIAAVFGNHVILRSTVEYQFNMRQLLNGENNQTPDYHGIIDHIVEGLIIVNEAQRLGVGAEQAEIEDMVNRARSNYNNPDFPEIKAELDSYCQGAGITIDDYYALIAEVAPATISEQKLRNEIGRQYCEEHGLEFTNINPPQEMMDAIEAYIDELFEANKDDIVYYIDD